jgi:hypothetical protein
VGFRLSFFVVFIAIILAACGTEAATPTPPLRGAIVPTRATPTFTPTATATFTLTPSPTDTPTRTFTPSATATPTQTFTPTVTPTSTFTATSTLTATATLTPTATLTQTPFPPTDTAATPVETTPEPSGTVIAYGDTVSGTITDDAPRLLYTFTGSEGDTVNIRMNRESGDLDPYLRLMDSEGVTLIENDDDETVENTRDSYISNFQLPTAGEYTIAATRFQEELGTLTGDFTLTLTTGTEAVPTEAPAVDGTLLTYGDTVEGTITQESFAINYTFEGKAGDVVSIRMTAEEASLDSFLILQSSSGETLIDNDDEPGGVRDSLIDAFELPADDTYTIIATRYQEELGGTEGDFELSLDAVSEGERAADTTPTPFAGTMPEVDGFIGFSDFISGTIDSENPIRYYGLQVIAGQTVTLSTSELDDGLDILFVLLDPKGKPLAYNDDSSRFSNTPMLDNIELPVDGQYTLVVARSPHRSPTMSGAFTVFASEGSGSSTSIATLPVVVTFGETYTAEIARFGREAAFTFSASAEDTISFSLEPGEPRLGRGTRVATAYWLVNPSAGIVVAQGNDPQGTVTIPVDGEYLLVVTARRDEGPVNVTITEG